MHIRIEPIKNDYGFYFRDRLNGMYSHWAERNGYPVGIEVDPKSDATVVAIEGDCTGMEGEEGIHKSSEFRLSSAHGLGYVESRCRVYVYEGEFDDHASFSGLVRTYDFTANQEIENHVGECRLTRLVDWVLRGEIELVNPKLARCPHPPEDKPGSTAVIVCTSDYNIFFGYTADQPCSQMKLETGCLIKMQATMAEAISLAYHKPNPHIKRVDVFGSVMLTDVVSIVTCNRELEHHWGTLSNVSAAEKRMDERR